MAQVQNTGHQKLMDLGTAVWQADWDPRGGAHQPCTAVGPVHIPRLPPTTRFPVPWTGAWGNCVALAWPGLWEGSQF